MKNEGERTYVHNQNINFLICPAYSFSIFLPFFFLFYHFDDLTSFCLVSLFRLASMCWYPRALTIILYSHNGIVGVLKSFSLYIHYIVRESRLECLNWNAHSRNAGPLKFLWCVCVFIKAFWYPGQSLHCRIAVAYGHFYCLWINMCMLCQGTNKTMMQTWKHHAIFMRS